MCDNFSDDWDDFGDDPFDFSIAPEENHLDEHSEHKIVDHVDNLGEDIAVEKDANQIDQLDIEEVFILGSMIAGNAHEEALDEKLRKKQKKQAGSKNIKNSK